MSYEYVAVLKQWHLLGGGNHFTNIWYFGTYRNKGSDELENQCKTVNILVDILPLKIFIANYCHL